MATTRRKRTTKKRTVKRTRRAAPKRTIKKKTSAKKGTRKAFGGYTINFRGVDASLQQVFGNKAITPSEMTKKLWSYVKRHKLSGK
jgi:chromatin remodeling complex protein RSC6